MSYRDESLGIDYRTELVETRFVTTEGAPVAHIYVLRAIAEFVENGKSYYGSYLTVSFPYSKAGFLQLFKGENFECLAEGLGNIFGHINGVPHRQWYDNMSTAVKRILKGL